MEGTDGEVERARKVETATHLVGCFTTCQRIDRHARNAFVVKLSTARATNEQMHP
jgi:hypothetical protein